MSAHPCAETVPVIYRRELFVSVANLTANLLEKVLKAQIF